MFGRCGLRPFLQGPNATLRSSSLCRSFAHSSLRLNDSTSTTSSTSTTDTSPLSPLLDIPPKKKIVIAPEDRYSTMQAERRRLASYTRYGPFGPGALKPLYSRRVRGDPVRGKTTPFVESFDNPGDLPDAPLKHFFTPEDVEAVAKEIQGLSPSPSSTSSSAESATTATTGGKSEGAAAPAIPGTEAIRRITSLTVGTLQDVKRANIQRCIQTFGRHVTDYTLPGKPAASPTCGTIINTGREDPTIHAAARAGPDTGSPEVQIAILTARIRRIANEQAGRGRKDIVARRNLTKLVHRRQQLLRYMHRKERGGPRWTNLIETLGLTEATWQGEINLPRRKGPQGV